MIDNTIENHMVQPFADDDLEFEEPRIPYASAEDSKRFLPIERERDARTRREGRCRKADALEIETSRILRTLNQAN